MRTDNEIEQLLRKAPVPPAPFGLERRLIQQVSRPEQKDVAAWNWFTLFQGRGWAPALALFLVLAGLITAIAVQQNTLNELKKTQQEPAAEPTGRESSQDEASARKRELEELQKQSVEVKALRAEMAEIDRVMAEKSKIAAQNEALRAELSNLTKNSPELSPEFQAALNEARGKAQRIKCVNNLKNIGLAARIWSTDNGDNRHLPVDFLTMTNELSTPKILICPSDPVRAESIESLGTWEKFGGVGGSYEMLSPGVSEQFPGAVYVRCPFHNNVARVDGSVMQLRSDQQVVQRDGRWEISE